MIKKLHHVAIAVRSLEQACRFYRDALGLPLHKEANVEDQGVKAALLSLGDCEIELLEPIDSQGGVARFLERRGEGVHHVSFETDDVRAELAGLRERNVELIDQEARPGLAGMVGFVHPRAHRGVLVELAEPVGHGDDGDPTAASEKGHASRLKRLDHLTAAVRDVEEAARAWECSLRLKPERLVEPAGTNARLARLPIGDAVLELVQPLSSDHELATFMEERGEGLFSLSVEVDDLEAVVADLRRRGVQVSDTEPSVPEGTRAVVINRESAHGVRIELVGPR